VHKAITHSDLEIVQSLRKDFPILNTEVQGKPLVYLDNAATTQKPRQVTDTILDYYQSLNSNIHRGAHYLANKATEVYEGSRDKLASFINAKSSKEINFVRGTTEGINLVAQTLGKQQLHKDDIVLVSQLEHHSNIVPWQMIANERGAQVEAIPVLQDGSLDLEALKSMLNKRVKIVALNYVSNSLGTINPIKEIAKLVHEARAYLVVDGAQAISHLPVDVQDLDCDFFAFSGHKMFGPTGIGILYGKESILETIPPYMGGGEMIDHVSIAKTTYNKLPYKFEAGTPNIAGSIALGAAVDYIQGVGYKVIQEQEERLLDYGTEMLSKIPGLKIYGTCKNKASVISFLVEGIHPYDLGVMLDQMGIAVRTGHHCCQPLMEHWKIEGTVRASFAFYNTLEEIDRLKEGIEKAIIRLMPVMDEVFKTEANIVKGCQSKVWLRAFKEDDKIRYQADSNTIITKGLIALLIRVMDKATPSEILATELSFINDIDLRSHLSSQRSNGFTAMIEKMKAFAEAATEESMIAYRPFSIRRFPSMFGTWD